MELKEILKERGSRYGDFDKLASISQQLKQILNRNIVLEYNEENKEINDTIYEGLEMILHKLARIFNGDPYYIDNYKDLARICRVSS